MRFFGDRQDLTIIVDDNHSVIICEISIDLAINTIPDKL
jgi:hypothetical protein